MKTWPHIASRLNISRVLHCARQIEFQSFSGKKSFRQRIPEIFRRSPTVGIRIRKVPEQQATSALVKNPINFTNKIDPNCKVYDGRILVLS